VRLGCEIHNNFSVYILLPSIGLKYTFPAEYLGVAALGQCVSTIATGAGGEWRVLAAVFLTAKVGISAFFNNGHLGRAASFKVGVDFHQTNYYID
jgi:hypothetical protein